MGDVSVDELKPLPLRASLRNLQQWFADPARPEEVRGILRQTRLDGAYFSNDGADSLVFLGVCLSDKKEASKIIKSQILVGVERVADLAPLRPVLTDHPPLEGKGLQFVPWDMQPAFLLQKKSVDDAKDAKDAETMAGALFWDNWYDGNGILHVDRVVHTPQQRKKADSWRETTDADPLCFRPGAKPPWRWKETKVEEGFMQVGALQAKLASDAGLKYIRLDLLYFTFRSDSKAPQRHFKGVCLNPAYGDASGEKKKLIDTQLDQKTAATWPSLASRFHMPKPSPRKSRPCRGTSSRPSCCGKVGRR